MHLTYLIYPAISAWNAVNDFPFSFRKLSTTSGSWCNIFTIRDTYSMERDATSSAPGNTSYFLLIQLWRSRTVLKYSALSLRRKCPFAVQNFSGPVSPARLRPARDDMIALTWDFRICKCAWHDACPPFWCVCCVCACARICFLAVFFFFFNLCVYAYVEIAHFY